MFAHDLCPIQIEYLSNPTRREPQGLTIDLNRKDRAKRYHKSSIFSLQFWLARIGSILRASLLNPGGNNRRKQFFYGYHPQVPTPAHRLLPHRPPDLRIPLCG